MKAPCLKSVTLIVSIISIIYAITGPVRAAETGEQSIQVTGGFFMSQGDAQTGTAELEVAYGYRLAPRWQTGLRLMASYTMTDPTEDVWTGSTTAYVNFYPLGNDPNQRLQPFIGTFLGEGWSDVDNEITYGPTAGLQYDFSKSTYFVFQYHYEAYIKRIDAGAETNNFDDGNHVMTMGLGYRWK